MQVALRPYLTSGVALVGASVIAVAPIAVAPPQVHLPDIPIHSAAVKLTAAFDPIAAYVALISNTLASATGQLGDFLANPAPILQQILANQLGSGSQLAGQLAQFTNDFLSNLGSTVPGELQGAIEDLAAGDIVGAGTHLVTIITQPALFPALITLLPAIQAAVVAPAQNLLNVANQTLTIGALAGLGVLEPIVSSVNASAQAIQNIVDAGLDPIAAVGAVIGAPAVVLNGILNGFNFDGGLINPGLSLVSAVRNILTTIATAIGAPAAMFAAASTQEAASVASPTSNAATTVTLKVSPSTGTTDSGSAGAGTGSAKGGATESGSKSGDTGAAGSGSSSSTDTDGTKHTSGTDGTKDSNGTDGTDGTKDSSGADGTNDSSGADGTNDSSGADGTKSVDGTKDSTGNAGSKDADGAKGTDGAKDAGKKADAKADSKSGDSK